MSQQKKLKSVPGVVQLPGGVRLTMVPFRVVEYSADGSPRLFEILPPGTEIKGPGLWGLFADETAIRGKTKP